MKSLLWPMLLGAAIGAGWGIGEIIAEKLMKREESNLSDEAIDLSTFNGTAPEKMPMREDPIPG